MMIKVQNKCRAVYRCLLENINKHFFHKMEYKNHIKILCFLINSLSILCLNVKVIHWRAKSNVEYVVKAICYNKMVFSAK